MVYGEKFKSPRRSRDKFNDTIADISELRCDGLVEVCYEYHNIKVWGKFLGGETHYNIKNDSYQAEHDDTVLSDHLKGLFPSTQCGWFSGGYEGVYWNTDFTQQDLCTPVGHNGG